MIRPNGRSVTVSVIWRLERDGLQPLHIGQVLARHVDDSHGCVFVPSSFFTRR